MKDEEKPALGTYLRAIIEEMRSYIPAIEARIKILESYLPEFESSSGNEGGIPSTEDEE